jgi:hypothetical protein
MQVREHISKFLHYATHADLAALYGDEHSGMECQVMAAPDGGQPTENGGYSDGLNTWFSFRIPKNARTVPEFEDWTLKWPLSEHCLAIGITGWNFIQRRSRHVAFDFDGLTANAHVGTGITKEELDRVRDAACAIPWIEVRHSTSGSGLHLRVYLGEGIETANHTEHAALARAILGMMSAEAGFNFADKIDVCGSNMWIWHRKMTTLNKGLELIKPRERDLIEIPSNWREHVDVVSYKRRKTNVDALPESAQAEYDSMSSAIKYTPLDAEHRRLIEWLGDHNDPNIWDSDHHCLRTHTLALVRAHQGLQLKGVFQTSSSGSTPWNCFCWPQPNGAWRVVRYGNGTTEANTWVQNGEWTYSWLNKEPNLSIAAAANMGEENPTGGFIFKNISAASDAARMLGAQVQIPRQLEMTTNITLKPHKDTRRLVMEIPSDENLGNLEGFIYKAKKYMKVLNNTTSAVTEEPQDSFDDLLRHLLSPSNKNAGWVININNLWHEQPKDNVICVLMEKGMDINKAKAICGTAILEGWRLVNLPFQPEYPGNRVWNRDSAQLRFPPADDGEPVAHPSWDSVLKHCGRGLDAGVKKNVWCRENGIYTGADYLKLWIASLFQFPDRPLPYLFFYSEPYQNCGKSTFHQAISLLMTKGCTRVDSALKNNNDFNGEIANIVLGVVEETDLSNESSRAYNRMKDWITSEEVLVHFKGFTPYMQRSHFHGVQCANLKRYCPIFEGDTRIVVIQVEPLEKEIPWPQLRTMLEAEAPAFLRLIKDMVLPPSGTRLNIPVVETAEKTEALVYTRSDLEQFLHDHCFEVPGARILLADFIIKFHSMLSPSEQIKWSKTRINKDLPHKYPSGYMDKENRTYIGNLAFSEPPEDLGLERLLKYGRRLVTESEFKELERNSK